MLTSSSWLDGGWTAGWTPRIRRQSGVTSNRPAVLPTEEVFGTATRAALVVGDLSAGRLDGLDGWTTRRPHARSERRFLKPLCPVHLFDTSGLVGSFESKRSREPVRRAVLRIQAQARSAGQGASDARRRARFAAGGRS